MLHLYNIPLDVNTQESKHHLKFFRLSSAFSHINYLEKKIQAKIAIGL